MQAILFVTVNRKDTSLLPNLFTFHKLRVCKVL